MVHYELQRAEVSTLSRNFEQYVATSVSPGRGGSGALWERCGVVSMPACYGAGEKSGDDGQRFLALTSGSTSIARDRGQISYPAVLAERCQYRCLKGQQAYHRS